MMGILRGVHPHAPMWAATPARVQHMHHTLTLPPMHLNSASPLSSVVTGSGQCPLMSGKVLPARWRLMRLVPGSPLLLTPASALGFPSSPVQPQPMQLG